MSGFFARLTLAQRLALAAGILGLGALLIGNPLSRGQVRIDERDLAQLVQGEVDHVTPGELADWIVAGRQDYRLLDLRDASEFATYHIPTAERMAISEIPDADLPRNEKIVLYSAEGIHSAQAWFLLKAKRYPAVYILLGGLSQWTEQVLYPEQPGAEASPGDRIEFAKAAERARFFGGGPRAASAASPQDAQASTLAPATPALPTVAPPPPATAKPTGKKNKKEGC